MPTLVELAAGEAPSAEQAAAPLDGRSLVPYLQGKAGGDNVAYGEYLAEGALAPMVMIRRGPWKYIASPGEPPQLFDITRDPLELNNLAASPAHRRSLEGLKGEAALRWDFDALNRQVLDSQHKRLFLNQALSLGEAAAWDYQPPQDAGRRFIRNNQTLDEQEARARYPRPPSVR
ncbi:hypothetical protein ABK905_06280 [Acerihabitans sp. KWT182]|uniref:Choline sulfatase enzyme C-terminal domain-containing protein n=1 Tax=Acerihabitans sp. KWT182 TaxID=3157919 RepID=A0AAU7QCT5_9GAMM